MRRDPRLNIDPIARRHHEKAAADEATLEVTVSPIGWALMLEPLGALTLSRARGEVVAPVEFPPEADVLFRHAFDHIVKRIVQGDEHHREPMEVILERRLAEHVGTRVSGSPAEWDQIASGFRDWKAWSLYVHAIPPAAIRAHATELARMPTDPSTCLDGFGALRDNFDAALRTLDERRAKAPDDWRWLDMVERFADEAQLDTGMSFRSELLARASPVAWLSWAANFPHPVLVATAVNDVDDLDFVEDLIECCNEARTDDPSRRLTLLLLIRRAVDLWERVDRGVARAATTTWGVVDADRAEYARMQEAWLTTELPQRTAVVAAMLMGSGERFDAAVVTARHLQVARAAPPAKDSLVRASFRSRLVDELSQCDVGVVVGRLLEPPVLSAGLLTASLLIQRTPSADRLAAVLGAYSAWLSSEDFFWGSPLDGDDRELVDVIASLLAQTGRALADANALLMNAHEPPQGWGFRLDAWFETVPRTAHVLIVIAAAAAHALNRGHRPAALDLMDLAWSELDLFLRSCPMRSMDDRVGSTVAYVWAYASRVFQEPEARVSAAIGRFDDLRLMISAAQNYTLNAGTLPGPAQRALREAFDARLAILQRHPHVSPEELAELRRQVAELSPAVLAP